MMALNLSRYSKYDPGNLLEFTQKRRSDCSLTEGLIRPVWKIELDETERISIQE